MSSKSKPVRQKHIPQRTCIVSRQKRDKRDLIRIVNSPDEGVVVDLTGKKNGRGAYVAKDADCWATLIQSTVLDQALKTTVTAAEKAALAEFWQSYEQPST